MPYLKMIRDILLDNYVVVLGILSLLFVRWLVLSSLKRLYDSQLRQFNKKVEDNVNYPFTTYEARMKWMPLVE